MGSAGYEKTLPRWRLRARAVATTIAFALGETTVSLLGGLARLRGLKVTPGISYAEGAHGRLDVYQPCGKARAVIVFFYGGRWQTGTRATYRFLAAALAARGYVVVIPDYRLHPPAMFADFLADGAQAVRWVRDHIGAFKGDPRRVFVMGHSAGAYIAAMLALDGQWLEEAGLDPRNDIAGLIGLSGPYDFLPLDDPILVTIFGGDNRPATQPIFHCEGERPPAILLTGAADETVKPGNSMRLAAKLRGCGNDATALIYPRLGHYTILAAFTPFVARLFAPMRDVDRFVARVRPTEV